MAVDSTHPVYDKLAPLWTVMRDTAEGERAVKEKGEEYLPALGGQSADEYARFKTRAAFYNATGRTIDGLSGMVFRKPPERDVPDGMDPFMEDVTLGGLDFQGFAECLTEDVLTVGRAGILVDFPRVETGEMTRAQADQLNLRPFFKLYRAEAIIDWRVGQVGNRTVLTQVRLREVASEPEDEFTNREVEQIRVLDLDDELLYRQRLYRQQETKDALGQIRTEWVQFGDDIEPTMQGKRLDRITFFFAGPRDCSPNAGKPPLIDLADKNLDHYRMDADYKHSLHFIAAGSTRWVKGVLQEEISEGRFDAVGPTALLASTSENAEFGICEPTGDGIPAQKDALNDAEQQMAMLGARMLSPEKRAAEAAETAAIHRQGESSVVSSLAQAISMALTKALEVARDWMELTGDVMVNLNSDYTPQGMSAEDLRALTEALQSGGISQLSYIEALQRGELLRPDLKPDEEIGRLLDDDFRSREDVV